MSRVFLALQHVMTLAPMDVLVAATLLLAFLLLALAMMVRSGLRAREGERQMAAMSRSTAELAGRVQTMAELIGGRQTDLARLVSERLDTVGARLGQGLDASSRSAADQLGRLNERLAVIDAAQNRLAGLTEEVLGLKDILANKQARGAYGQGRMEAIIRDALPAGSYLFQPTLSNRTRPDCCLRLPGDDRPMVVDAKFPLEAFVAFREADDGAGVARAAARVRADVGKHIKDIAERYLLPGETQDIAMLFVPSESLYADLHEHFEDVVARAHRANVIVVSPSLLMMAVQVMQALVRDARVREQAHMIQSETRLLVEDVRRLHERIGKLGRHFAQAGDDLTAAVTSCDKLLKRGERIDAMDFGQAQAHLGDGPLAGAEPRAAE